MKKKRRGRPPKATTLANLKKTVKQKADEFNRTQMIIAAEKQSQDVCDAEFKRQREINRELMEYKILMDSRAGRLLKKGKEFITVAMDEIYYADVYRTIRRHKKDQGKWNNEDEVNFQASIKMWCNFNPGTTQETA